MSIRLIAADMDGTLLRSDKTVSKRTVRTLNSAIQKGCVFVPATGRVAKMLPKAAASIPGVCWAITSNGASVLNLKTKAPIFTDLMTEEQSVRILTKLCATGYLTEAYCSGVAYSERRALDRMLKLNPPEWVVRLVYESQIFVDSLPEFIASHRARLEKVNMPYLPDAPREQLYRELSQCTEFSICSSCSTNIEINKAGCSKGKALKFLCEKLGILPEEVMAEGDGGNDMSMLKYAGLAVAMQNAEKEVLAQANFITKSNDEDGAAAAVEKFVLA